MGPRAPRSSRPSSPRAAHEGSKLIFGSPSRSRVSIARASHQRPRSLQTRAARREAPKLPGSQAQGPPGYPYGIALRFCRAGNRIPSGQTRGIALHPRTGLALGGPAKSDAPYSLLKRQTLRVRVHSRPQGPLGPLSSQGKHHIIPGNLRVPLPHNPSTLDC